MRKHRKFPPGYHRRSSLRKSCSNIFSDEGLQVNSNGKHIGDNIQADPRPIFEAIYLHGTLSLNPDCYAYWLGELKVLYPDLYNVVVRRKECHKVLRQRKEIRKDFRLTLSGRRMLDKNEKPLPINPKTRWKSLGKSSNPLMLCWDLPKGAKQWHSNCPSCSQ